MFHYFNAIQNKSGDALSGFFVKLVDPATDSVVTLYSDNNATPIIGVSGVADTALTDTEGNVSFYVAPGEYHLDIYAPDGTSLYKRVSNVPMGLNTITLAAGSSVSTRDGLAAIALPVAKQSAILTEAGREGTFVFDSSNLSAKVTADPQQGIYVAPSSDTTGASGAWVRKTNGITVTDYMFGAVDGADNAAAIEAWANYVWANDVNDAAAISSGFTSRTVTIGAATSDPQTSSSFTRKIRLGMQLKATAAMDTILLLKNVNTCSIDWSGCDLWGANSTSTILNLPQRLAKNAVTVSGSGHMSSTGTLFVHNILGYAWTNDWVGGSTNHFVQVPYIRAVGVGSSPRAATLYAMPGLVLSANWTAFASTQNGTLTTGSAVVTALTSTAGMIAGQGVTGTGIPANTRIQSVDSATQITLNANATATGVNSLTIQSRAGVGNSTNQTTVLVLDTAPGADPQGLPQWLKIGGYYYKVNSVTGTAPNYIVTIDQPWVANATIGAGTGTCQWVYGGAAGVQGSFSGNIRFNGLSSQYAGFGLMDLCIYGAVCSNLLAGSADTEVWYCVGNTTNTGSRFGGGVLAGYSENDPVIISCGNAIYGQKWGIKVGPVSGHQLNPLNFYKLAGRLALTNDLLQYQLLDEFDAISGYEAKRPAAQLTNGAYTTTWDPPSVAAGGSTSTTMTLTNLPSIDTPVRVTFSNSLQGMVLSASVTANTGSTNSSTVTVTLTNPTAGAIDLASGTLTAMVLR